MAVDIGPVRISLSLRRELSKAPVADALPEGAMALVMYKDNGEPLVAQLPASVLLDPGTGVGPVPDGTYGDIVVDGLSWSVGNQAINYSNIRVTASDRLLGRDTAGTGEAEELTLDSTLRFLGTGGIGVALQGINNTHINISQSDKLLGRDTAGSGAAEQIGVAGGLAFLGDGTIGIRNEGIANDMFRDSVALSVVGRYANSTGPVDDIVAGANDRILRRVADVLEFGQLSAGMFPTGVVSYASIQDVSATDKVLGRSTAGAGDIEEIACTAAGRALLDDASAAVQRATLGLATSSIQVELDGRGEVISTGFKCFVQCPIACTITDWELVGDVSGSMVVDVWKDTAANFPPTDADTITASAKPTLTAQQRATSSSLTGWTTSVAAGDWLAIEVESCSTIEYAVLKLGVTI